jgi:hypothetical protein
LDEYLLIFLEKTLNFTLQKLVGGGFTIDELNLSLSNCYIRFEKV